MYKPLKSTVNDPGHHIKCHAVITPQSIVPLTAKIEDPIIDAAAEPKK